MKQQAIFTLSDNSGNTWSGNFLQITAVVQSMNNFEQWIDRKENEPDKTKRILTYEEGVRRGVMICEFYEGQWRREDNEKISFFDLWQPLPLPTNK